MKPFGGCKNMKYRLTFYSFVLLFSITSFATDFSTLIDTAEGGDPSAQRALGLAYYFGGHKELNKSIEVNSEKAIYWLKLATESGDCFSPWFLGGLYFEGKFVAENKSLAAKYFLIAAQRGNVKAQRNIASFYYYGKYGPQDYERAYAWATVANFIKKDNSNTQALLNMIIPKLHNRDAADKFVTDNMMQYLQPQGNCGNT